MTEEESAAQRRGSLWRSVLSGILIVIALIVTPVAAIGSWARVQLVDTDRFVATFGPLAHEPEVQAFLADQAAAAVNSRVDFAGVVGDLFDGLEGLGLPPRTSAALGMLEEPAVLALESLVATTAQRVVTSEGFSAVWEGTLRVTHSRAVHLLQSDFDGVVVLDDEGLIAVDVGLIVDAVRSGLAERSPPLARLIPEVSHTIPLVQSEGFLLVRGLYAVADAVGFWLPWLVLALLAMGILIALNRRRALMWTSIAFAGVLGLFLAGIGIGRVVFIRALAAATVPPGAADAIYSQVLSAMRSTVLVVIVLSLLTALIAWSTGPASRAAGLRRRLGLASASA